MSLQKQVDGERYTLLCRVLVTWFDRVPFQRLFTYSINATQLVGCVVAVCELCEHALMWCSCVEICLYNRIAVCCCVSFDASML